MAEAVPARRPEAGPARRRLFVAVWPPPDVMDALAGIARPERKGLRWTTPDQWHVTLRFLGNLDASAERSVRSALASVDWPAIGPAQLTVGPQPVRLGRGVWVLPVEGADQLASATARAVCEAGVDLPAPDRGRTFNGHITLARAKAPPAMKGLPATPITAAWTATDVTLVSSTLAPTGARYEIVDSWSLLQGSSD